MSVKSLLDIVDSSNEPMRKSKLLSVVLYRVSPLRHPQICFIDDSRPIYNYFSSETIEAAGGSQRQEYLLAKSLYDIGHPISVLTGMYTNRSRTSYEGIEVWTTLPKSSESTIFKKAFRLTKSIRTIDADVYFIRGRPRLLVACIFNPFTYDKNYLYSVANRSNIDPEHLNMYSNTFRIFYKKALKLTDHIVAQTEDQSQILQKQHGVDSEVIPNGYNPVNPKDITSHGERDFVLWVGRINKEQKQPHIFLDVAEQLPNIEFKMIGPPATGEDEYYTQIKNQATVLPNLEFEGFVPHDEIHQYYRKAAALVNTSKYEGFPNTFLEAWRYKVPVVSLHYSLNARFESDEIGIYAGSIDRLISAIDNIWNDIQLRNKLGENGFEYFKSEFSLEKVSTKYSNVITRMSEK